MQPTISDSWNTCPLIVPEFFLQPLPQWQNFGCESAVGEQLFQTTVKKERFSEAIPSPQQQLFTLSNLSNSTEIPFSPNVSMDDIDQLISRI